MQFFGEKGQSLLIVVLVMVVALTIGLSVASRSITNLRIASEEQNSQAAFSAAEAGIEKALRVSQTGNVITDQPIDTNVTIKKTVVTPVGGGKEFLLNNGNPVAEDDGADVWLIDHNTDGTLNFSSGWQALNGDKKITIYWGATSDTCSNSASTNTAAAVEVIIMSGTQVLPVTSRYTADPCDSSPNRKFLNNFGAIDGREGFLIGGSDKKFAYRMTLDIKSVLSGKPNKGILVRVIPLYASTRIAVRGCSWNAAAASCDQFPLQGKQIDSTGNAGDSRNTQPTVRRITYYQGYPKLPSEFFQYVLFSSQK